ncbi:MAG: phosphate ABC transporter permease subunit PstC [Terriglobia bacterium]
MATLAHPTPRSARPEMPGRARAFLKRLQSGDEIAHLVTLIFALVILLITILLVYELYTKSALPRRQFGWGFLTARVWDPVFGHFGALTFIYGTVVTSAIALVLAVPLGVGGAIFLAEFAPARLSDSLTFVVELLAAVPSVIYGLLGIFTVIPLLRDVVDPFLQKRLGFLPIFAGPIYGVGLLAAGVVLAIMIVPFIISISREALLAVPNEQREAALSLGATQWESTWQVVTPYARAGIMGSVFLALARALGETMAVTMVIGSTPVISASLFSPGYSIASVIADQFTEATGPLYLQSLIELGLALFFLTIILNGLARLLILATEGRGTAH